MSISLFIESDLGEAKEQTLLVPTENEVLVFHRLSNGQRGRGQAWQSVKDLSALPDAPVTAEPIGILISQRDVDSASIQNVTSLSTRANNVTRQTADLPAHSQVVSDLFSRLMNGDATLNSYVTDGRRSNPVVLYPIKPVTTDFIPAITPTAEPLQDNVITLPSKPHFELAQVPDKRWADEYLNRKVSGVLDYELLDIIKQKKQNLLIRGHAGSGKTMLVMSWASARGYRYYNISSNVGLEPSHLFGSWIPTEKAGVFKWQDGAVTDLVRNGGVLLLNEIDFMPERVTTVLFGLLDARREIQLLENGGEVIKAHPDLIVIGDHNPNYRGARPMNQAWKDRFHHKWEFEYDTAIERKLIKNDGLLTVAKMLRERADKGELDTPISTRGLVAFMDNAKTISLEYAVQSFVNGFADDEREAVKLVFDTEKSAIANGLGIEIETGELQPDEEQN